MRLYLESWTRVSQKRCFLFLVLTLRGFLDMKIKTHIPLFALVLFHAVSVLGGGTEGGGCMLSWNTSEYVAMNECGDVEEDIGNWGEDGFPSTLCCRNALTFLTHQLANANNTWSGKVFLPEDQWQSCSNSFHPQQGVTLSSCGFNNLYQGSSRCSNFDFQHLRLLIYQHYSSVLDMCSHFDKSSFYLSCANCTAAVSSFRDDLYSQVVDKDDHNATERAVCSVAAIVALAAVDDPSFVDKVLRCMPPPPPRKRSSLEKLMSVPIVIIALIGMLVGFGVGKCLWKRKKKKKKAKRPFYLKEITTWSGLYWFSKAEIENAMNYRGGEKICLGRGSAGQVYRGVLPSGQVVAIKHLTKSNTSDSFTREVEGLSRLRHPNLVCLFGCCIEGDERYLVYEFCANGNLAQHLLRRDSHLTWETRVRILRDCSFALKYLHNHIEGCVVHRDIKITNILLNEKYQAKLSDFGLAKMMGIEESKVFTDVRGTIGYMDPEYMSNAKLTCASDVYSFGIVALQILSGQKVIELDLDARDQLTRKARDVSMGKRPLSDFEDPRLNGKFEKADFGAILQIAVLCVAKSSKGRPPIEVVFDELDKVCRDTEERLKAKQDESASTTSTPSSKSSKAS